ncbi:hypothetical protein B0T24DRAFT_676613 [Lasiosphaeria ovina]|uniref:Uncharacterized protein n=1 Tax=Lasiosphaeria ovina TaxID=92902 RepID=A0AAE0KF98_9PEZI|nr:hypothetical protein B0T24DRAFT_676613 [Lasiosphaeria ovina]
MEDLEFGEKPASLTEAPTPTLPDHSSGDTSNATDRTSDAPKTDDLDRTHTTASSYTASSLPPGREIVFVAVVCCAQLTTQASLGQSLSIAHVIGRSYGVARPEDLAWFLAAWGICTHMVFSIFGAMAPIGAAIGAVFAALFSLAWWPWAFWSFVLALLFFAGPAYVAVPSPPTRPSHVGDAGGILSALERIDLVSALIGIISLLLINVAWDQAPIAGWQEPYVYILLIIGVLLIPAFLYVELCVAKFPLLPLDALKLSDIGFVLGCLACGWGCFGIWFYYLWQFHLELRGASPLLATA